MTPPSTSTPDAPQAATLEEEATRSRNFLPVRTSIPAGTGSRLLARSVLRTLDVVTRKTRRIKREVRGLENLDTVNGPYIIACNHLSLLDSPMVHVSLPRRHSRRTAVIGGLDFFAPRTDHSTTGVLWRRLVVWFIRSSVNVALIDRNGGDYSNFEQIGELLSRNWSLVIFPEATRSRSGSRGRMRLGVAELARQHDCPVFPAHIGGTNSVLPIGSKFPRRGVMRISIGAPIQIDREEPSRLFVNRLAHHIDDLGAREWAE